MLLYNAAYIKALSVSKFRLKQLFEMRVNCINLFSYRSSFENVYALCKEVLLGISNGKIHEILMTSQKL